MFFWNKILIQTIEMCSWLIGWLIKNRERMKSNEKGVCFSDSRDLVSTFTVIDTPMIRWYRKAYYYSKGNGVQHWEPFFFYPVTVHQWLWTKLLQILLQKRTFVALHDFHWRTFTVGTLAAQVLFILQLILQIPSF